RRRPPAPVAMDRRELAVRLNGFVGIHVHRLHHPLRLVGADREQRKVEWTEAASNLAELRVQRRVAGEEHPVSMRAEDPAAPERAVPIPGRAAAEMARRRARDRDAEVARRLAIPPAVLSDGRRAELSQIAADADGRGPSDVWRMTNQAGHRTAI